MEVCAESKSELGVGVAMSEKEEIAALTKGERRRLARHVCGWCEIELHRSGCLSMDEKCSEENRRARRTACLSDYKPRVRR